MRRWAALRLAMSWWRLTNFITRFGTLNHFFSIYFIKFPYISSTHIIEAIAQWIHVQHLVIKEPKFQLLFKNERNLRTFKFQIFFMKTQYIKHDLHMGKRTQHWDGHTYLFRDHPNECTSLFDELDESCPSAFSSFSSSFIFSQNPNSFGRSVNLSISN